DLVVVVGLLQHPGLPVLDTNGWLPAGAAGLKANLIRVLEATMKGPGAAPSTRLINGLRRPRTSGVSGHRPDFHPATAASRRAAPRLIRHIRGMRSSWWEEGQPSHGPRDSARGCPLST